MSSANTNQIETDKQPVLIHQYVEDMDIHMGEVPVYHSDPIEYQLSSYNEFIRNTIQDIIEGNLSVESDDHKSKIHIQFNQVYITPPVWRNIFSSLEEPLFPSICISHGLTYSVSLECDMQWTAYQIDDNETDSNSIDRQWHVSEKDTNIVTIGKLPILVGCMVCTFADATIKTDQSVDALHGTGGYFIINGQTKGVIDKDFPFVNPFDMTQMFKTLWSWQIKILQKKLLQKMNKKERFNYFDLGYLFDDVKFGGKLENKILQCSNVHNISVSTDEFYHNVAYEMRGEPEVDKEIVNEESNIEEKLTPICSDADEKINYLELDNYMMLLDNKSLNTLTTAQLMQRLRSNNLSHYGFKHELIERWRNYKMEEKFGSNE